MIIFIILGVFWLLMIYAVAKSASRMSRMEEYWEENK